MNDEGSSNVLNDERAVPESIIGMSEWKIVQVTTNQQLKVVYGEAADIGYLMLDRGSEG
jgi:hypothetical protein